ncbi:MAG: hypothetical protein R3B84_18935 [Zavarzinella sp.]
MLDDNFEDRITGDFAQWITFVTSDDSSSTVRIGLTHNPEISTTEKLIEFIAVTKIESTWDDQDDECMESIIGAHEDMDGECMRYTFHTEQRDLLIWSELPASIRDAKTDSEAIESSYSKHRTNG